MKSFKKLGFSWWIMGIFIAILLVVLPLLKPGFIVSDDGDWMIIRLSAFFQSLREGQFPVRFLGRLNNNYGYPVANFLYPGFLYIGSIIHILGFSFTDSVKIIFIASLAAGSFCVFYWLKSYFSSSSSFLGTLGFIFSPYLLFDVYKRGSVGEVLATAFAALTLFSIEKKILWFIPVCIGMLILSHNSLGFLFFIFLIGYIFIRKKISYLVPVFIGLGLSTFFWFPAIYERKFILFDLVTVAQSNQYFLEGSMLWLIGVVPAIAFFMVLKNRQKKEEYVRNFFLIIFAVSIVMSTALSASIWTIPIMGKLFQFPYRFLSLGFFSGSWIIAYSMQNCARQYRWYLGLFFIGLLVISVLFSLSQVVLVQKPDTYYSTNEATTTVANEYMPKWVQEVSRTRAYEKIVFYQGSGKIESNIVSSQKIDTAIFADEPSIIQLNSIYYPGWGITIDDEFIVPDYKNVYGLMRVAISPGKHRLIAEFRETPLRFLSDVVSISFVIYYIGFIVLNLRKGKNIS